MWMFLKRRPLTAYLAYRALALTWAYAPFQVYYLQRHGLSVADVFDLNVVFCIAAVLFEVPTGAFADRRGRRVAMSLGAFVMTLSCACFVLGRGLAAYALANVLSALSMCLSSGADSAFLYDHLEARKESTSYARWEGLGTAAKGVGNLGAVLVGALIYQYIHPAGVFWFTAATTAVAGVLALGLPERRVVREGRIRDHLARALRTLQRNPRLITLVVFGAVSFVLLRLSLFADQPHLEAHLHGAWLRHTVLTMGLLAGAKEIGTALLAGSAGFILGHARARTLAVLLAAGLVVAYALMGFDHGALCTPLMVLLATAFGLFSPLMRLLLNTVIDGSHERATLLSVEGMGRRLLFAAMSPLFGRAVEASSLHATFSGTAWVAGLSYVGIAALGAVAFGLWPRRAAAAGSALATS